MNTIIVQPSSRQEQQLLTSLFKRMGVKAKLLSEEDKEDLGLAGMMRKADRKQKVSKSEVMKKLGR
jgi:hypothetical protein